MEKLFHSRVRHARWRRTRASFQEILCTWLSWVWERSSQVYNELACDSPFRPVLSCGYRATCLPWRIGWAWPVCILFALECAFAMWKSAFVTIPHMPNTEAPVGVALVTLTGIIFFFSFFLFFLNCLPGSKISVQSVWQAVTDARKMLPETWFLFTEPKSELCKDTGSKQAKSSL